jgi:hypothetical protein
VKNDIVVNDLSTLIMPRPLVQINVILCGVVFWQLSCPPLLLLLVCTTSRSVHCLLLLRAPLPPSPSPSPSLVPRGSPIPRRNVPPPRGEHGEAGPATGTSGALDQVGGALVAALLVPGGGVCSGCLLWRGEGWVIG